MDFQKIQELIDSASRTNVEKLPVPVRQIEQKKRLVLRCENRAGTEDLQCQVEESKEKATDDGWLNLFQRARGSVVQILADSALISPFSPHESVKPFQSRGSGWFIKENDIVTNAHVVIKANQCHIRREAEGERPIPVSIVSICPFKDLAVLEIANPDIVKLKSKIEPLKMGDSDQLKIPAPVSALGFQLGFTDIKMTIGNLTGYHRELEGFAEDQRTSTYLQISSPITSGSSGGPLLDEAGRVVGVNSQGIPGAGANVGFSIPPKVIFSVARSLFSKVYPDKIVPVPILPFSWQTTNLALMRALNVGTQYAGGLYITKLRNPYWKSDFSARDLQPKDVIVEILGVDPYRANKNYLDISTYQSPLFFPNLTKGAEELPLDNVLLDPSDKDPCQEKVNIPLEAPNDFSRNYLTGGATWNVKSREDMFPAFKITFHQGDETVSVWEKLDEKKPWTLNPLYEHRKTFITDILDFLPAGMPLLFVIYRKGKKICLQKYFTPILPQAVGLRKIYPPFENFKDHYEIVACCVYMDLFLNHLTQCVVDIVKRLDGPLRFQPAVILTNIFPSSVARMDVLEPLEILHSFQLLAPVIETTSSAFTYKSIAYTSPITTVRTLRDQLMGLVDEGIRYYETVVTKNLEYFRKYLHEGTLRTEIQAMREGKRSWTEVDQYLLSQYGGGGRSYLQSGSEKHGEDEHMIEQRFIDRYLPLVNSTKSWQQLLTLQIQFDKGQTVFVGFPEIFAEDQKVQSKQNVPLTHFASVLYTKLNEKLWKPFNKLFQVPTQEPKVGRDVSRFLTETDVPPELIAILSQ